MSALIEHLREVTPKQWFWLILLCAVAGYLAGKLVGHFFRTTAPAALELSKTLVGAAAGVAVGMVIGSFVPEIGTAIGGVVGGIVGGIAGFYS